MGASIGIALADPDTIEGGAPGAARRRRRGALPGQGRRPRAHRGLRPVDERWARPPTCTGSSPRRSSQDELVVHYQPIVDLSDAARRRVRGARPLAAPVPRAAAAGAFLSLVQEAGCRSRSGSSSPRASSSSSRRSTTRRGGCRSTSPPTSWATASSRRRCSPEISRHRVMAGRIVVELTESSLVASGTRIRHELTQLSAAGVPDPARRLRHRRLAAVLPARPAGRRGEARHVVHVRHPRRPDGRQGRPRAGRAGARARDGDHRRGHRARRAGRVPAPQRLAVRAGLAVRQRAAGRHQPADAGARRRAPGPVGVERRRSAAAPASRPRRPTRASRSATCAALSVPVPSAMSTSACTWWPPSRSTVTGVHSTPDDARGPGLAALGREGARALDVRGEQQPGVGALDAALAVLVRDEVAEAVGDPHALAARPAVQLHDGLRDVRVVADDEVDHARVGQLLVDRVLLGGRLGPVLDAAVDARDHQVGAGRARRVACATSAGTSMRFTDHGLSASIGMPFVPYAAAMCATVIVRPARSRR